MRTLGLLAVLFSLGCEPDAVVDPAVVPEPEGPREIIPLYDAGTELEPEWIVDRGDAIVTRFADRGRDRHAREDQFQSYDHFLPHYWEYRTARMRLVDYVAKGGSTIDVSMVTDRAAGRTTTAPRACTRSAWAGSCRGARSATSRIRAPSARTAAPSTRRAEGLRRVPDPPGLMPHARRGPRRSNRQAIDTSPDSSAVDGVRGLQVRRGLGVCHLRRPGA